ncbi:MAG: dicarboxylate/amino acid:cation symporter [Rhodospirillales bacterium]
MRSQKLTMYIMGGLVLGIACGYALNTLLPDQQTAARVAGYISLLSDIFLRLIKMIIGPLVFCTLVAGIAKMGSPEALGRIGGKALLWFICASLLSLLIGMVMVNLFAPGAGLNLPLPEAGTATNLKTSSLSLKDFVTHLVPKSFFEAMADNEILQIVVFSVFFGVALVGVPGTEPLVKAIEKLGHVILRVTNYVMLFAPIAVFAAITAIITTQGVGVLLTYGTLLAEYYLSLGVLWTVLFLIGLLFLGRGMFRLMKLARDPFLLAFSTASSEAAFPRLVEALESYPISKKIVGFVLPMGYSFNLDGSMMYATFATLFLAQAYGVDLSIGQQVVLLLVLMVTSKGIAGVPRSALVVVAATLPQFNIPEAGVLLLFGVDQFFDMGRSATNVIGNSLATAVIAKWEGDRAEAMQELIEDEKEGGPGPAIATS